MVRFRWRMTWRRGHSPIRLAPYGQSLFGQSRAPLVRVRHPRDVIVARSGFPLVVALVILLGSSLVIYADRPAATQCRPSSVSVWPAAVAATTGTRRSASTTATTSRPTRSFAAPSGPTPASHSHDDGVIHIHPFVSSATGTRARLKVFFETEGLKFTDDELELTNGNTLKSDTDCNGKNATLRVARFDIDNPDKPVEIITSKLGDVRFLSDREAFTIALVPDDVDIPIPPTAANLDALAGVDSGQTSTPSPTTTVGPTDSTVPGSTAPGTTAATTDSTAPTTGSPTHRAVEKNR